MDLAEIENRLKQLLPKYRETIPAGQIEDMIELVSAGEPGIALENFCTQLYEYSIKVDDEDLNTIILLGKAMKIDPEHWEGL